MATSRFHSFMAAVSSLMDDPASEPRGPDDLLNRVVTPFFTETLQIHSDHIPVVHTSIFLAICGVFYYLCAHLGDIMHGVFFVVGGLVYLTGRGLKLAVLGLALTICLLYRELRELCGTRAIRAAGSRMVEFVRDNLPELPPIELGYVPGGFQADVNLLAFQEMAERKALADGAVRDLRKEVARLQRQLSTAAALGEKVDGADSDDSDSDVEDVEEGLIRSGLGPPRALLGTPVRPILPRPPFEPWRRTQTRLSWGARQQVKAMTQRKEEGLRPRSAPVESGSSLVAGAYKHAPTTTAPFRAAATRDAATNTVSDLMAEAAVLEAQARWKELEEGAVAAKQQHEDLLSRFVSLQTASSTNEEQREALAWRCDELELAVERLEGEKEAWRSQCEHVQSSAAEAAQKSQAEAADLDSQVSSLQRAHTEVCEKLHDSDAKRHDQEAVVLHLTSRCDQLQQTCAQLEAHLQLEQQVAPPPPPSPEVRGSDRDRTTTPTESPEHLELKRRFSALEAAYSATCETLRQCDLARQNEAAQKAQLQQHFEHAERAFAQLQDASAQDGAGAAELQARFSALEAAYNQTCETLRQCEEKRQQEESQKLQLQQHCEQGNQGYEQLQKAHDRVSKQVQYLQQCIATDNKTLAESQKHNQKGDAAYNDLLRLYKQATKNAENLREDCETEKKRCDDLNTKLEEVKAQKAPAQDALHKLTTEIKSKDAKIKGLMEKLDGVEWASKRVSEMLKVANDRVHAKEKEVRQLKEQTMDTKP